MCTHQTKVPEQNITAKCNTCSDVTIQHFGNVVNQLKWTIRTDMTELLNYTMANYVCTESGLNVTQMVWADKVEKNVAKICWDSNIWNW